MVGFCCIIFLTLHLRIATQLLGLNAQREDTYLKTCSSFNQTLLWVNWTLYIPDPWDNSEVQLIASHDCTMLSVTYIPGWARTANSFILPAKQNFCQHHELTLALQWKSKEKIWILANTEKSGTYHVILNIFMKKYCIEQGLLPHNTMHRFVVLVTLITILPPNPWNMNKHKEHNSCFFHFALSF